jgi:hypothetical protein
MRAGKHSLQNYHQLYLLFVIYIWETTLLSFASSLLVDVLLASTYIHIYHAISLDRIVRATYSFGSLKLADRLANSRAFEAPLPGRSLSL